MQDKKCYGLLRDVLQRPNSDGTAAQLVGLVADQRCNSESTRADVSFLSQPTRLATGAARLHLETGSTLWFAAVLHNKRYYTSNDPAEKPFRLVLRPVRPAQLKQPVCLCQSHAKIYSFEMRASCSMKISTKTAGPTQTADRAEASALVQTYALMLEKLVLDNPEQYLWMHDLWNTKRRAAALVE